jgi:hypothetical protein
MTASEKRLAEGKCKFCDEPLETTRLCKFHAAQAVQVQRQMFQKRKDAGNCTVCNNPRGTDGTESMCADCADSMRKTAKADKAERKARGQCRQCPNKIAVGRSTVFCETCLEKHRNRYRKKK